MHNKINNQYVNNVQYCCRVPQGTCGLKSFLKAIYFASLGSGPARDLWIEIELPQSIITLCRRRFPQGTCGLKFYEFFQSSQEYPSGPARDLWIEIDIKYEALRKV